MKLRDVAPLALIVVLGGCSDTDWDNVLSFPGTGDGQKTQPEPRQEDQQASHPWQPVDGSAGAVETATLPPPTNTTPPWTPVGTSSQPPLTAASPLVAPPRTAAPRPVSRPPVVAAPVQPAPRTVAVAPAPEPPQTMVAAAAPPVAEPSSAAPAADPWCAQVAQSALTDAASQGFDEATQRRRAEASYNQCVRYGH